jgi:hypothetical protein
LRIAEAVNHQTLDWRRYFRQLRETIRPITNDPSNGELSVDERIDLARRLLAMSMNWKKRGPT